MTHNNLPSSRFSHDGSYRMNRQLVKSILSFANVLDGRDWQAWFGNIDVNTMVDPDTFECVLDADANGKSQILWGMDYIYVDPLYGARAVVAMELTTGSGATNPIAAWVMESLLSVSVPNSYHYKAGFGYDFGHDTLNTLGGQILYSDIDVGNTVIDQAAWNVDPMNGNGPSKTTLNWFEKNVYEVDVQPGRTDFYVNGYRVHTQPLGYKPHKCIIALGVKSDPTRWGAVRYDDVAIYTSGEMEPITGVTPVSRTVNVVGATSPELPLFSVRPVATLNGDDLSGYIMPALGRFTFTAAGTLRIWKSFVSLDPLTAPSFAKPPGSVAANITEVDKSATAFDDTGATSSPVVLELLYEMEFGGDEDVQTVDIDFGQLHEGLRKRFQARTFSSVVEQLHVTYETSGAGRVSAQLLMEERK